MIRNEPSVVAGWDYEKGFLVIRVRGKILKISRETIEDYPSPDLIDADLCISFQHTFIDNQEQAQIIEMLEARIDELLEERDGIEDALGAVIEELDDLKGYR